MLLLSRLTFIFLLLLAPIYACAADDDAADKAPATPPAPVATATPPPALPSTEEAGIVTEPIAPAAKPAVPAKPGFSSIRAEISRLEDVEKHILTLKAKGVSLRHGICSYDLDDTLLKKGRTPLPKGRALTLRDMARRVDILVNPETQAILDRHASYGLFRMATTARAHTGSLETQTTLMRLKMQFTAPLERSNSEVFLSKWDPEDPGIFYDHTNQILFTNRADKGHVFSLMVKANEVEGTLSCLIHIDDDPKRVVEMESAAQKLNIPFVGLTFTGVKRRE